MLHLSELTKHFYDPGRGPVAAVDGIDVRLSDGTVAIVGANGAGKSTVLRCIAALLQPDSGGIVFDDIDVCRQPERMGYLSTTTRLYPRLTAREHLSYAGGFYGLRGAALASGIARVSEHFGLQAILDQRCEGLSTGQAQRVDLARALLTDPDLLVLDEPTTGLDIQAARRVIETVAAARRPGRLILLSTHLMHEVEELADRVLVLAAGRLAFDGTPSELAGAGDLHQAVYRLVDQGVD